MLVMGPILNDSDISFIFPYLSFFNFDLEMFNPNVIIQSFGENDKTSIC